MHYTIQPWRQSLQQSNLIYGIYTNNHREQSNALDHSTMGIFYIYRATQYTVFIPTITESNPMH